ncbi:MAG TPA: hypothetical protein PLU43_09385, partial [Lachnospiraceae bacterium]|nr:hypothetical protein [Lachnospiraceae bacterium]
INTLIAVICTIELLLFVFSINYIYITTKPPYIRRPWVYGMILTAMGLLFIVRALINIIYYTWGRVDLSLPEIGVNIADLVISVFWIISGILLLVKKRKFHIIGILSYFHGSLLFVALIIFMAIQPLLCGTELIITDLFVIGFMSLLFIIPCILLLRKITDPETSRP